jgi:hypothetical protein
MSPSTRRKSVLKRLGNLTDVLMGVAFVLALLTGAVGLFLAAVIDLLGAPYLAYLSFDQGMPIAGILFSAIALAFLGATLFGFRSLRHNQFRGAAKLNRRPRARDGDWLRDVSRFRRDKDRTRLP